MVLVLRPLAHQFLAKLDIFVAAVEQNLESAVQDAKKKKLTQKAMAEHITTQ